MIRNLSQGNLSHRNLSREGADPGAHDDHEGQALAPTLRQLAQCLRRARRRCSASAAAAWSRQRRSSGVLHLASIEARSGYPSRRRRTFCGQPKGNSTAKASKLNPAKPPRSPESPLPVVRQAQRMALRGHPEAQKPLGWVVGSPSLQASQPASGGQFREICMGKLAMPASMSAIPAVLAVCWDSTVEAKP
jgi:hypothetical protein